MEALNESNEVQSAKKVRAAAKAAVTRIANQLKKLLVLESGEKYNFQKLDKFSLEADADKLKKNLDTLQTANEQYATVGYKFLESKQVTEDILDQFNNSVDSYWTEARQEATELLNLYKFEYTTGLKRYLQNIEEEGKLVVAPPVLTTADKEKAKKKSEGELRRQLNRWEIMKAEWYCQLEHGEKIMSETKELQVEDLLKKTVVLAPDIGSKLIGHWAVLKSFQETLFDLFEQTGVDDKTAAERVKFDPVKDAKRLHLVIAELDRLAEVKKKQEANKVSSDTVDSTVAQEKEKAPLKMDRIQTPKFSGKAEDFASWKERFISLVPQGRDNAEICVLLEQAVPEGKQYLLRGCGNDYTKMLDILQKELAPTRDVVNAVNLQLSKLKRITSDDKESDKKFVLMVETIEKMVRDLKAINRISALANCTTIQEIEGKLPLLVKTDWFKRKREKSLDEETDGVKFDDLLSFLVDYKYIAKDGMAEYERAKASNAKSYVALVTGQCMNISSKVNPSSNKKSPPNPSNGNSSREGIFCLACQDGATNTTVAKHETADCDHWFSLSFPQRRKLVKCEHHPRTTNHVTSQCKYKKPRMPCKFCKAPNHHSLFCPIHKSTANLTTAHTVFVSELPQESSSLKSTVLLPFIYVNVKKIGSSVMDNQAVFNRLGTLTDNCATDSWITFAAAKKMGLQGHDIKISAGGFGGNRELLQSKLYTVLIKTKNGLEKLDCLGVKTIGNSEVPPNKGKYSALCRKFNVLEREVRRPVQVDMLIGQRHNHLHPEVVVRAIDGMKLLLGPLGMTFAGVDNSGTLNGSQLSSTFFTSAVIQPSVISLNSSQVKNVPSPVDPIKIVEEEEASLLTSSLICSASRELLDHFKLESIGVDCSPRCGNCSCGHCAIGAKIRSIKEEREYEVIKSNLKYDSVGSKEDPGPYWRSVLPWVVDKNVLGNNKTVVMGTLNATLRKLDKDPNWRRIYEDQLKVLIVNGFARKVSDQELSSWTASGKKCYYISHQVVVVPDNKTTPVRVVFNSSQQFMGQSLNNCLALGPEILNNLQGILLRFRDYKLAAAGDIRKMFYCVRVALEDQMCQLWCHKFLGSDKVETFAMTRLVMGNKPSTSISGVAIKETSLLEDFAVRYPHARQALDRDSYVDNTNCGADTVELLQDKITEIEYVASKGGFNYKPWVVSGAHSPNVLLGSTNKESIAEKNLGVLWLVTDDCLQIKPVVGYGGNKRKGQLISLVPVLGDIQKAISLKLRLRDCLSVHSRCFDPLGLVMPVKMVGNLLFRESLQSMKVGLGLKVIPWDHVIPVQLLESWLAYFSMLEALKDVKFPRSVKPDHVHDHILPDLVTFGDGNEAAFGAVIYVLWTLKDNTKKACLYIAKAKLSPLTYKGEVVKSELAAATYSARLKLFVQQESNLQFNSHIHFTDSQIVQFMLRKDSYGFNTFAGLRVLEIQKKTDINSWHHIPSAENISDVLTKGTTPDRIGTKSIWQNGPSWLVEDKSVWPITELSLSKDDHDILSKFTCKSKSEEVTAALNVVSQGCATSIFDHLLDKSSDLDYILRVVALTSRAIKPLCGRLFSTTSSKKDLCQRGSEASQSAVMKTISTGSGLRKFRVISSTEISDAWNTLIALEQTKSVGLLKAKKHMMLRPHTIALNNGSMVTQLVLGSRVKLFPIGFQGKSEIPYLPMGRLAKLVAEKYHNKFHVDIDTTVCHVRNKVFIPQLRRLLSCIDRNCLLCKLKRKKFAGQIMGELPDFRTNISPPFSHVLMDLFGPFTIRDDCVKKGPRVLKKVWGVVFSCASTRAVQIDTAVNYDTKSVLHCIRRLKALRGSVKVIVSDPGSQLIGADNEMKSWRKGWSEVELAEFGSKNGIEWQFISANSQHQNGGAEIMVKLIKGTMKALMEQLGEHVLSLNELNTVMMEATNLINSRPIGIKPNQDMDTEFLTPNSLLLGRNADCIDAGPFMCKDQFDQGSKADTDRFLLVQRIVDQFWSTWMKNYFPTLLVRKKWHYRQRNLKPGDICFLQDSNEARGQFRKCRVAHVFPDRLGVVRNVEVLAATKQDGSPTYHPQSLSRLRRHANNLILIKPVDEDKDQVKFNPSLDTQISADSLYFRNLVGQAPSKVLMTDPDAPVLSNAKMEDGLGELSCTLADHVTEGASQVPASGTYFQEDYHLEEVNYPEWTHGSEDKIGEEVQLEDSSVRKDSAGDLWRGM